VQADTGELHIRRTCGIGGRVPKTAGRLVDAGIDSVGAQEPNDHLGIEVVVLHQTVHILVLSFVTSAIEA
jgi:hypothetical protein